MQESEYPKDHKAGFISILGKPNVGKSTLMNELVGERLSIITSKAQTTRHRIMGIINEPDFQAVYSDTPGIIKPMYDLHESMMGFVNSSITDADIIIFITDIYEKFDEEDVIKKLQHVKAPILLLVNKIDQVKEQEEVFSKIEYWKGVIPNAAEVLAISALEKFNLEKITSFIKENLPVHPPYFPKDQLTDKPERFFASEMVREKIFTNYKKEVPYCTEVEIEEFIEEEKLIRIRALIYVERTTQKGIIIGHQGKALKKVGTEARIAMEQFFQKKVFLQIFVKVEKDWRTKGKSLKSFGYNN